MYRLAKEVYLEEVDGTKVFLKSNGDAAVLNPVGKTIVDALFNDNVESCVELIVCDYEVSKEEAKMDVLDFVERLLNFNLIEAKQ